MAVIPLVSVVMITYNHEKYIQQAVEGVLMQQCNFPVELIIADDNSPDTTEDVVKKILINHPNSNWVKYTKHKQNKGMIPNFMWSLEQCKGKYIALCEGDDYWTDPLKLQKQVDFLEENEELSLIFHSVIIKDLFKNIKIPEIPAENRLYNIDELLLTKVAHTCSFVFPKVLLDINIFKHKNIFGGDLILVLSLAERGEVFGVKDNMATYRMHEDGISNLEVVRLGVNHYIRFIKQFIFIKKQFKTLSKKAINLKIVDNCFTVANYYYIERNILALKYVLIAIYHSPGIIFRYFKKIIT